MGLESIAPPATAYIDDLVSANPDGSTDEKREGDDHIRGIKNVLKLTFPNLSGAMTCTQAQLNKLDGFTGTQADLNLLSGIAAASRKVINFAAGTACLFYQDSAPTGWTIVSAVDEHMVRLTGGDAVGGSETGGTTGGTNDFVDQFTSITTGSESSHTHGAGSYQVNVGGVSNGLLGGSATLATTGVRSVTGTSGAGSAHDHTVDLRAKHANCIIASLDA